MMKTLKMKGKKLNCLCNVMNVMHFMNNLKVVWNQCDIIDQLIQGYELSKGIFFNHGPVSTLLACLN